MTTKVNRVVTDEMLGNLARRQNDLFNRVAKGSVDFNAAMDGLQLLQENNLVVAAGSKKSRRIKVSNILARLAGEINILGHEVVTNFWGIGIPRDVQLRYSEATLREAIAANKNGEQWALVYYAGHSLRQMKDKIGTDRDRQPCFDKDYTWWLNSSEDSWATKTLDPGYYLLNFKPKFANKKWADQNRLVSELGNMYEWAHETIVSEAVISNFGVNNQERLLNSWYHWGQEAGSVGSRVCVGDFGSGGFRVSRCHPSGSDSDLRVVVSRKFDF